MIKLFISDIDGTLLNEVHELAQETKDAIIELRASGVSFMLASGRNYEAIMEAVGEMNIKIKCIALNGGDYRDNQGESIITYPLDDLEVDQVYEVIKQSDATLEYYCENGSYTQLDQDVLEDIYIDNFMYMFSYTYEQSKKFIEELNIKRYMQTEKDVNEIKKHKLIKIEFHFKSLEEKDRVEGLLNNIDDIQVTTSAPLNIEVTHDMATKGNMIDSVCEYYGYKKEEVAVIGDSMNDVSMFNKYPNSYAMGNASEEVKAFASNIAPSNAENGVAQTIYKIIKENAKED